MSDDPVADLVVAGVFDALSIPVTYNGADLLVVPRVPDPLYAGLGGGQVTHDGLLVEARDADLPADPQPGDTIVSDGRTFRVRSARWADRARSVWLLDAVLA